MFHVLAKQLYNVYLCFKKCICFLTYYFLAVHCLCDRLKMDGGWGWKMAKWGHFHAILSKKSLFPQKVDEPTLLVYFYCLFPTSNLNQHWKTTQLTMGDTLFTDVKHNEGKIRPKLTDAVFNKGVCNAEITLSDYMDCFPLISCILCLSLFSCLKKQVWGIKQKMVSVSIFVLSHIVSCYKTSS